MGPLRSKIRSRCAGFPLRISYKLVVHERTSFIKELLASLALLTINLTTEYSLSCFEGLDIYVGVLRQLAVLIIFKNVMYLNVAIPLAIFCGGIGIVPFNHDETLTDRFIVMVVVL